MGDSFITERELSAHLTPIREDITEIKGDVKSLVSAQYSNSWFGGRGQAALVAVIPAVVAAVVALLIALFL